MHSLYTEHREPHAPSLSQGRELPRELICSRIVRGPWRALLLFRDYGHSGGDISIVIHEPQIYEHIRGSVLDWPCVPPLSSSRLHLLSFRWYFLFKAFGRHRCFDDLRYFRMRLGPSVIGSHREAAGLLFMCARYVLDLAPRGCSNLRW